MVMSFWLMDDDSQGVTMLDELLERKWGAPDVLSEDGDETFLYSKRPRIEHTYDGHYDLLVSPR